MAHKKYPENTVFAKNGSVKLWTQHFGDKQNPAVLLVHGTGSLAIAWPDSFCNTLAKSGFFVIRYDQRDCGYSTHFEVIKPGQPAPYTAEDLGNDAWAVLNEYAVKKAHCIGRSMGGLIVEFMMVQHPERVLSSILVSTFLNPKQTPFPELNLPSLPKKSFEYMLSGNSLQGNFEDDWPIRKKSIKALHGSFPVNEEMAEFYVKTNYQRKEGDIDTSTNTLAASATYPLIAVFEGLKKTTIPTLVIHGTEDYLVPFDHGQAVAKLIPTAEFYSIEKAGHLFFNEKLWDVLLTPKILAFLKK